jgi:hypothetical protein
MPNTWLEPDIVAQEALVLLQSNLVATRLFSRRYESDLNSAAKVGDTVRVRRRGQGTVQEFTGTAITPTEISETSLSLTLEKHFDATVRITDRERTLSIVDFSQQVLAPFVVEMGERIDSYALTKLRELPTPHKDTAGALPNSIAEMALVDKALNDLKIPLSPRYQIASTEYKATLLGVDSFSEVDKSGASSALRQAQIGEIMGINTFMSQNVLTGTHTAGTGAGTAAGALGASSLTLTADGNNVAILEGDLVDVAGYGYVRAAADASISASTSGALAISEPLRAAVTAGSAFTVFDAGGTYQSHGAAFHPDAFAFVSAPLDLPIGAEASYIQDPATGLSIRAVFDYDRDLKADVLSLDILVGAAMVDGRLGVQIIKDIP